MTGTRSEASQYEAQGQSPLSLPITRISTASGPTTVATPCPTAARPTSQSGPKKTRVRQPSSSGPRPVIVTVVGGARGDAVGVGGGVLEGARVGEGVLVAVGVGSGVGVALAATLGVGVSRAVLAARGESAVGVGLADETGATVTRSTVGVEVREGLFSGEEAMVGRSAAVSTVVTGTAGFDATGTGGAQPVMCPDRLIPRAKSRVAAVGRRGRLPVGRRLPAWVSRCTSTGADPMARSAFGSSEACLAYL